MIRARFRSLASRLVQNLVGQRALSGTGNAGDAGKDTQRNIHIDVFQVILGGSQDFQPAGGLFSVPSEPESSVCRVQILRR